MLADARPGTIGGARAWFTIALALMVAGFRRYSTYRQAMFAGLFVTCVFGLLRTYVLLAVAGPSGAVAGYRGSQLVGFVWIGQALLVIVLLWGWTDLSDRVRTGEVAADLLRPVGPYWAYLFADLGRAAYQLTVRLVVMVGAGMLLFGMYVPRRWTTYPEFLLSTALGVVICFSMRYLVNLTSFWLLDNRGIMTAWALTSGLFSGLTMPITFFPDWAQVLIWLTPFPAIMQVPLDTAMERHTHLSGLGLIGLQAGWVALLIVGCLAVERRAVRRLVVQGG